MFAGLRGLFIGARTPVLTLTELKSWLRVDHDQDDALISELELGAQDRVSSLAQRSLLLTPIGTAWDARAVCPNGRIYLPRPPLIGVSEVQAITAGGDVSEILEFQVDTDEEPGWVELAGGWPAEASRLQIDYDAGYAVRSEIPQQLIQALRMLVAHWYENREDAVVGTIVNDTPHGVRDLCRIHKVTFQF